MLEERTYNLFGNDETILCRVKMSLRIKTEAFDEEIQDLIIMAISDMSLIGINCGCCDDPLILQAVITYVKMNFGEPGDYNRLKASYDEQKAQLKNSEQYRINKE